MKKHLITSLIFTPLLSTAQTTAKTASVVFTDGSTHDYVVKDRQAMLNPHRFILTDGTSGKEVTITPLEAKSVSIAGGDTWIGAKLDVDQTPVEVTDDQMVGMSKYQPRKDTVFLLSEFKGSVVSLYSLQDHQRTHLFLTKQGGPYEELIYHHYVQDDNGRQLEREDKQYQAQIAEAVKECPLVAEGTDKLRFSVATISDLLKIYERDCLKSKIMDSRYDREKGHLAIFPMVGYTLNRPSFSSSPSNDLVPRGTVNIPGTPSFGVSLVYQLPVMKKRLALSGDFYFNSYKAHADTVKELGSSPDYYKTKGFEYQISTIRTAFQFQYYITKPATVRPFIKLGFAFGYSPTHKSSTLDYQYLNGVLTQINKKDPLAEQGFRSMQFGFTGGLGVEISKFAIQYKYESYSGYVSTLTTTSSLAVHSLFIGYKIH